MLKNILAIFLAVVPSLAFAKEPVVGFLTTDAERRFAEDRDSNPYAARVLKQTVFASAWPSGIGSSESGPKGRADFEMLRQFNVMVLDTPFDFSIMDLGPEKQRTAAAARGCWKSISARAAAFARSCRPSAIRATRTRTTPIGFCRALGWRCCTKAYSIRSTDLPPPSPRSSRPRVLLDRERSQGPSCDGGRHAALPSAISQRHDAGRCGRSLFAGVAGSRAWPTERTELPSDARAGDRLRPRGTFHSAPPIVAVRSYGKGRIMAMSVPARSVHLNYGVPGWNMIVESAGDRAGNRPSDGGRLSLNGLRWLAETSRDTPGHGGFNDAPQGPVVFPKSIAWDDVQFPKPIRGVRGIIGAHTALSDGEGTVAQYVTAAKAAGLSFIVFNESAEKMTAEKLDQLKAECKQASAADFYACPGLEFTDDLDNRWAIWSERVRFPQASFKREHGANKEKPSELVQWDGKVLHNSGEYWIYCSFSPNMLLTYRNLRQMQAHPANMWWFFRVAALMSTIAASWSRTNSRSGSTLCATPAT